MEGDLGLQDMGVRFPAKITFLDRIGEGLRVGFVDGRESRVFWNEKRQRYVVPRRWRKPR